MLPTFTAKSLNYLKVHDRLLVSLANTMLAFEMPMEANLEGYGGTGVQYSNVVLCFLHLISGYPRKLQNGGKVLIV